MVLCTAHHFYPATGTAASRIPAPKAVALFGANFFMMSVLPLPQSRGLGLLNGGRLWGGERERERERDDQGPGSPAEGSTLVDSTYSF